MSVTYVVDGAKIKCSQGIGQSTIHRTLDNTVMLHDKTLLTIAESKPYINISPFPLCKSMQNPVVIAANGVPSTCTPNICMKWMQGKEDFTLGEEEILKSNSKLSCLYGGLIQIVDDGQRKL